MCTLISVRAHVLSMEEAQLDREGGDASVLFADDNFAPEPFVQEPPVPGVQPARRLRQAPQPWPLTLDAALETPRAPTHISRPPPAGHPAHLPPPTGRDPVPASAPAPVPPADAPSIPMPALNISTPVLVVGVSIVALAMAVIIATTPEDGWDNTLATLSVGSQLIWTCALFSVSGALLWWAIRLYGTITKRVSGIMGVFVLAGVVSVISVIAFMSAAQSASELNATVDAHADAPGVHALQMAGHVVSSAVQPFVSLIPSPLRTIVGAVASSVVEPPTVDTGKIDKEIREARARIDAWIERVRPVASAMSGQGDTSDTVIASMIQLYGDPPPAIGVKDATGAALDYVRVALFSRSEDSRGS